MPPPAWIHHSLLALMIGGAGSVSALTLQLDYSNDPSGYLSTHPVARDALAAAAADIGSAITTALGAVNTDTFTGTNGGTTATMEWDLNYKNPVTNADVTLDTFTLAASTVRIYVGMRPLSGSTLGVGGPAGVEYFLNGGGSPSQWTGAVTAAQNNSNSVMSRGGGPIMASISGSSTLGGTTANFTLLTGSLVGSLSLDSDRNNNGTADTVAELESLWHFDHTTAVAAGKTDFYSVALHEMLHALGIGTSESWESLVSGTTWLGGQAAALNGTNANLITSDGSHIAEGKTSPRLRDGVMQEVAMDPSIITGTRKELTLLDLAFLRDIGWTTVPEPGSAMLLLMGGALMGIRRPSRRQ